MLYSVQLDSLHESKEQRQYCCKADDKHSTGINIFNQPIWYVVAVMLTFVVILAIAVTTGLLLYRRSMYGCLVKSSTNAESSLHIDGGLCLPFYRRSIQKKEIVVYHPYHHPIVSGGGGRMMDSQTERRLANHSLGGSVASGRRAGTEMTGLDLGPVELTNHGILHPPGPNSDLELPVSASAFSGKVPSLKSSVLRLVVRWFRCIPFMFTPGSFTKVFIKCVHPILFKIMKDW
ncbi:unnamed protein product [Protopolystoma xenopodis]|uniref:Uncharacterized protein n=1 Tax=Protopolystoma xenopodis TaxID=117903 RepID=A0A3S5CTK7_9PLAT|nr:unnamed protein product [Protopolystoma xenopodis]